LSIKMLREALCREQQRASQWPPDVAQRVAALIDLIDLHRPLGPDGTHGHRHTTTCGCDQ